VSEPEKALAALGVGMATCQEAPTDGRSVGVVAQALTIQGRYRECLEFTTSQPKLSPFATHIMVDCCRALGDEEREFQLIWKWRKFFLDDDYRLARLLELAARHGKAREALAYVLVRGNSWQLNDRVVRPALIRARIAAGQRDLALSDAQRAWLAAKKEGDEKSQTAVKELLDELGATPLDALPAAREFLSFPEDCRIHLLHDQTIEPPFARRVAFLVANFWGCAVHLWAVELDPAGMASYRPLAQTVEGQDLAEMLAQVRMPPGPSPGTVLLTQTKLVTTRENYTGDMYAGHSYGASAVSDHYLRKFKRWDPRPLPLQNAIAVAALTGVSVKLRMDTFDRDDRSLRFQPLPPDVFANNGSLRLVTHDLGVSPRTGALLRQMDPRELIESIAEWRAEALQEGDRISFRDRAVAADLSRQIASSTPFVRPPIPSPSNQP